MAWGPRQHVCLQVPDILPCCTTSISEAMHAAMGHFCTKVEHRCPGRQCKEAAPPSLPSAGRPQHACQADVTMTYQQQG